MSRVSIIMYHYVREIDYFRYPEFKGLEIELFESQLKYLMKNYQIIRMEDMIGSLKQGCKLPSNAALLTFDDGYIDHFTYAFPILMRLKIQGSFFIPARTATEHKVLDVNKIHFILAVVENKLQLVEEIYSILDDFRSEYKLKSNKQYFRELAVANRFDTKEVIFIKMIFQKELPEKLRDILLNRLFAKYVTKDEISFSKELYMNIDQIKYMKRAGMYIGNHGYSHCWMDTLDRSAQEEEVDKSLQFLQDSGCSVDDWVMCYPYGAYNKSLISVLKSRRCALGLTIEPKIADLKKDNILTLPRMDTNDICQKGS